MTNTNANDQKPNIPWNAMLSAIALFVTSIAIVIYIWQRRADVDPVYFAAALFCVTASGSAPFFIIARFLYRTRIRKSQDHDH